MAHVISTHIAPINMDADPINENWLRIMRAERLGHWDDYERLSGHKLKRPTPEELALKVFVDDDAGYGHWCEWANGKTGYVLNTYRVPSVKYLMLHRVTCRHIRQANSGSQNWTRLYAKVCSLDREELTSWAETHTGAASQPLRHLQAGSEFGTRDGAVECPYRRVGL